MRRFWTEVGATCRRSSVLALLFACSGLLVAGCADQNAKSSAATPSTPVDQRPSPFALKPAFQDDFGPDWEKQQQHWRVATWKQNGTVMSPERCATDGKGHLIQTVLAGEPYRGGSIQTSKEYPYGRWVARVRPSAVPGVLNSVFTKDWDDLTTADNDRDGTGFEVDIEFLTYTFAPGRGKVHLAIHGGTDLGTFAADPELNFNPSDDFHEWGFDILPDRVVWHVDGKELRTWKCPEGKIVPVGGHEFFFNSWTAPKWIKGPPKETATYSIDWVRFYPLAK